MKKLAYLSILMVLVLGTVTVAAQVPQKPEALSLSGMLGTATHAGIGSVVGSTVNYVSPDFLPPGPAFDLCFNVTEASGDLEYLDGFDADLPDNWTVNSVTDVEGTGCGYGHTFGVSAGNGIYWLTEGMPTGCGDWVPGTYDFCANVTVPDCTGSPWSLGWNIWGDTYGDEPHSVSGTTVKECQAPGIYLTPVSQEGTACEEDDADYMLNLFNNTGQDGTFDLAYTSVWPISGPASIFVANGATADFEVSVTVPCGGTSRAATIDASGGGHSDSATLITNSSVGGWTAQPNSPSAAMDNPAVSYGGKLYVVDGYGSSGAVQIYDGTSWTIGASSGMDGYVSDACLGLDASGNPVIDILGDTTTFTTMERYDINADTWSFPAIPSPIPSSGLWAPDIASMLQYTGENVCYISGGATVPGGGDSNALYAYYPDTQTAVSLGSFTAFPAGVDFHFDWYVPWIGSEGGICIGGGVDVNEVIYDITQCHDIGAATFNAANADLGPLPQAWWGGGDAWKLNGTTTELWGVNGVDAYGNLLQGSFYYDGTAFVYGPEPLYGVYRMEADNFGDTVWAANGSTGGFSPSTFQESLVLCPGCSGGTLTCDWIGGIGRLDPFARRVVKWKVAVIDQDGEPVGSVAVTADMTSPGRSATRTRLTNYENGIARFPWGAGISGTWTIDVTNMVLDGYTFLDGEQCSASGQY